MIEVTIDKHNYITEATVGGNGAIVAEEALIAAGMLLNALSVVTNDDEEARDILIRAIKSEELLKNLRDSAEVEEEQWQA